MFSTIWTNPFTTTVGAAAAITAIISALGFHVDSGLVNTVLIALIGLFAKDGNVTGGTKPQ